MKRFILFSLVLISCTFDKSKLSGAWQAVGLYEQGQTVTTPLDSVRLTFSNSRNYTFKSIGFYEESGVYRIAGNYLFLQDTTASTPRERAVKVEYLTADSLKIGMEVTGKKQVVFFGKMQQQH